MNWSRRIPYREVLMWNTLPRNRAPASIQGARQPRSHPQCDAMKNSGRRL